MSHTRSRRASGTAIVSTGGQMSTSPPPPQFPLPPQPTWPPWGPPPPASRPRTGWGVVLAVLAVLVVFGGVAALAVVALVHNRPDGKAAAPAARAATTRAAPAAEPAETEAPSPVAEESSQPSGPRKARFGAVLTLTQGVSGSATLRVERPVITTSADDGFDRAEHGVLVSFRVTYATTTRFDYNALDLYVRGADGSRYEATFDREPALDAGTLSRGEPATGWVTFDAPPHGTLVYAPDEGPSVAEWTY